MTGYDYIVIGAGSAGCVLAARLSEDGSARVLLLEAGGPDSDQNIRLPANTWKLWKSASDWCLTTSPQPGAAGRTLDLPRGKVLGGSSSINGAIYIRGCRDDFDQWAYLGNAGWDYDSVLPWFKKSEDYWGGAGPHHGSGGPLAVTRIEDPSPLTSAFIAAGRSLGIPQNDDFAGPSPFGIGLCDLNITDGRRCSAADAFLRPAMNRPNLTVLTGALVHRLTVARGRCTGVDYLHDGALRHAVAEAEVILSAGVFGSPKLLMLSGIGPAAELRAAGVAVAHDLPGVGKNLCDHLLSFVIHEAKRPLPPRGRYAFEAHLFARSDPRLTVPDHQPLFMNRAPSRYREIPPDAYAIAPGIIRPVSRGDVCLTAADPDAPLHIDPGYLREPADVATLVHSLELAREILHAPAFADWRKGEVWPQTSHRAALEAHIRQTAESYHHQAGTCRMGIDSGAVVDPALRVRGVAGLRVADASIMPAVVSGNTNAATIMIGEKAADMIRGL